MNQVEEKSKVSERQYSTFYISNRLYGIDVTQVQEIVKPMPVTPIPLAPDYVRGLINLRGQVATALGLRELFGIEEDPPEDYMNIVCRIGGSLISFHIDKIGDVKNVVADDFEETPQTISERVRRFMEGVYKVDGELLSVINIALIMNTLNNENLSVADDAA